MPGNHRTGQRRGASADEEGSTGHTLQFYVVFGRGGRTNSNLRPTADQHELAERFRTRIQQLLPGGSRFLLHWEHDEHDSYRSSYAMGYYRAEIRHIGPPHTGDPFWKRALEAELNRCISGSTVRFLLEYGSQAIVGGWQPRHSSNQPLDPSSYRSRAYTPNSEVPGSFGRLDVRGFERARNQLAAAFLVHELSEQRGRQRHGLPSFEVAHWTAIHHETAVMGAQREQDWEYQTRGITLDRRLPPGILWQWWIPYRRRDNSILAAVLHMREANLERSRIAHFPDVAGYMSAADAAGLVPKFPDRVPTAAAAA